MDFEDVMDQYREAFDLHGETVTCCTCDAEMDELTVSHEVDGKPQCDRCYWENHYACTE